MSYTSPNPECKIKTFTHKSVYERHLKTNCCKPKEPTVCDICGKCFKYPSKLQEHLNNKKKCSPPVDIRKDLRIERLKLRLKSLKY